MSKPTKKVVPPKAKPVPSCLWDREGIAEQVDDYWRGSADERAHRKRLAKLVAEYAKPGDQIVEVGCGTGLVYEALRELELHHGYTGIDCSRPMLDIASNRYHDGLFRQGYAESLDYSSGWFDVGLAFEVFGHVADFRSHLAELLRVSSRVAVFTVWLTAADVIVPGTDHYEHTYDMVIATINSGLAGRRATITLHDMGNSVEAFVIEKEKYGTD